MSESVGSISLDLVIQENLSKQLESIKSKFSSGLSKPVEKVEKAVEQTFESMGNSVDEFTTQTKQELSKLAAGAVKPMQEMQKKTQQAMQEAVKMPEAKPVERKVTFKTVTAKDMLDAQGLEDPINKAKEKVDELNQSIKEAVSGFEVSDDPTERLRQELDNTNERIALTQKKWQELSAQLDRLSNKDIALGKGNKIQSQMNRLEKSLISLRTSAEATEAKLSQSLGSGAQKGAAKFSTAFSGVKANISQLASSLKSKLGTAVSGVASGVKKVLGGAFNSLKTVGGKALNTIKDKISGLRRSVNSTSKPLQRLGNSIRSAAKSALLMAGLYAAFRGLKSAVTEACNSNDEFAKSLNEVKANLQIAFTPIMQTIMPYINSLMSAIASATRTIAAFISELFGSTYKKSLEATKAAQKTAKQIEKTQKNYLASFDEMNVAQDTSESSGSADDSESGIDYSAINGDNVQLPDWAARMKDAIKAGDWNGVGSLLAEKVNGAFNIDWTSVQEKVNGAMRGIADGLNGFVHGLDWAALGDSFAGGINTVFGGAYTFMTTFDWSGLGEGVTTSLNNAVEKNDFKLIGKTLASKFNAAIDFLYEFVTGFDWSKFGRSIGESVNSWFDEIDWAKLGETLSGSITGLLDSLLAFLEETDWQKIGEDIGEFICGIDWTSIAVKVLEVAVSALSAAVETISGCFDNLSTPGQVLVGIIGALTAGIIAYKIAIIASTAATKLAAGAQTLLNAAMNANPIGLVVAAIATLVTAFTILWNKCDGFREFFINAWEKIKDVFSTVGEFFSDIFSTAWDGIKSAFSAVGEFFGSVWKAVKKPFVSVVDWFKNIFTKAWEGVKNVFSKGGEIFSGIKEGISETFFTVVNGLIDGINWVIAKPFEAINAAIGWIRDIEILDWQPFGGLSDIGIPQIPKLANGGLAYAPQLAMVGDNKNARNDPEVIAPLSKLQGMLGEDTELLKLLLEIIELMKNAKQTINLYLSDDGIRALSKQIAYYVNDLSGETGENQLVF